MLILVLQCDPSTDLILSSTYVLNWKCSQSILKYTCAGGVSLRTAMVTIISTFLNPKQLQPAFQFSNILSYDVTGYNK